MENKKTKLTISGTTKKSFKNFKETKFKDKKTVIIDKKQSHQTSNKSFGLKKLHLSAKKIFFEAKIFRKNIINNK